MGVWDELVSSVEAQNQDEYQVKRSDWGRNRELWSRIERMEIVKSVHVVVGELESFNEDRKKKMKDWFHVMQELEAMQDLQSHPSW